MKRIGYALLLFSCIFLQARSQAVGEWEIYLSYYNTTNIAEANNYIFAIGRSSLVNAEEKKGNGSLYSYNKEDNSIKFYSKKDGLHDNQIDHIGFNADVNKLMIVYNNGNIDLLEQNNIYNLPHLLTNSNITNKSVNGIYFYKEYAYLPTEFGIMVVNLKEKEITDTYQLNQSVHAVCIKDNDIYAATDKGILKGSMSSNLLDKNNWQNYPLDSNELNTNSIKQICIFQGMLFFLVPNDGVYYQQADQSIKRLLKNDKLQNMKIHNEKLIPFTETTAYIFSSLTDYEQISAKKINDISYTKNNTYWIACSTDGIAGLKKKESANNYEIIFSDTITSTNGPKRNLAAFLTVNNQKLLVAGGGRDANRSNNYGSLMVHNAGSWFNFDENKITNRANVKFSDITCIAVDPTDENHYFVSTWGEGVFEFKNNEFIKLYNYKNSSLSTIFPDNLNYIRVEGICFDNNNNLWMTNSGVSDAIKIMSPDGKWSSLHYPDLTNKNLIDKILITSKGQKWINVLRDESGNSSVFVLNDNNTIKDVSDDIYSSYSTFNDVERRSIPASRYHCITEDKNGFIWMGTSNGIVICPVPQYAPGNDPKLYCSRIVRTDDDGIPGYFLDGQQINAIAIDGGNRKWIATEGSGIFLINEDGSETIHNFTTENSPLPSDKVKSIAIDQISGKVYIGTTLGIVSYVGEATQGREDYSDVYAFPNPVRPEYNDQVTITGLMENSNVKITDVGGNLIYQGKSVGGQLTWNCRNGSGSRVATGVYLVLSATPESKESIVTKIMVIK